MAEEEGGKHLSFSIIFLQRTFVNILVSIGEYFLTAGSPCFLHYFPRRQSYYYYYFFTLWLLCSLYKEVNYPNSRRTMDTVYLHSFHQKLQRDRHGKGEREDGRVQTGFLHTGEGDLFQICLCLRVAYWSARRPTLSIASSRAGLPMEKGWAVIQLWLKKSLLAILDGQRKGETHMLLFAFAWWNCATSPERNGS